MVIMDEYILESIFSFIIVLPAIFFGYLIVFKKQNNLTSPWKNSRPSAPDYFGLIIGYSLFIMAIGIILTAIVQAIIKTYLIRYMFIFVFIPIIAYSYAMLKYGRN